MLASGSALSPEDVRAALECLYENVALGQTRLAAALPDVARLPAVADRAEALRRLLLAGIEMLQPPRRERFGSRAGRSYEVLNLRYVEGLSVVQVADELSVVERQVYRDLRQAYEDLARVLAPRPDGPEAASVGGERTGRVQDADLQEELARLIARPLRLDATQVLQASLQSVTPLAARLGTRLEVDLGSRPSHVSADEGILKQVLTQVLSLAVQSASLVAIALDTETPSDRVLIRIGFSGVRQAPREQSLEPLQQLASAQHLHLTWDVDREGRHTVTVSVPAVEPRTLLVIEDNVGAIELYRRFLAHSEEWRVVGASDPRLSYDMAQRLRPSVIVLDVMMPQQDGWTVLQVLRAQPQTARTPIIICSVFDDPALASALGADACLKKPVSQVEFVAALARLTAAPSPANGVARGASPRV